MQEHDRDRAAPSAIADAAARRISSSSSGISTVPCASMRSRISKRSAPLDQWLMLAEKQIVGFRPVDPADLVDVAEPLRRQQGATRAAAFEDRVDRDRRAVQEQLRLREPGPGLRDAGFDAVRQTPRRRQRLAEKQFAGRRVEPRDVGKCAADIGRQSQPPLGSAARGRAKSPSDPQFRPLPAAAPFAVHARRIPRPDKFRGGRSAGRGRRHAPRRRRGLPFRGDAQPRPVMPSQVRGPVRCSSPDQRHRLTRIAHHRDPDQVAVADNAVGRIELDPAGARQIHFGARHASTPPPT